MRQADINWLPNHLLKDIPDIKVVYEEDNNQQYGGYYEMGSSILTIVESETMQSTIAHEFCHFLQDAKGYEAEEYKQWKSMRGTYNERIYEYFTSQLHEMDALLFEYKYAKDYLNDWWLNKLVMRN